MRVLLLSRRQPSPDHDYDHDDNDDDDDNVLFDDDDNDDDDNVHFDDDDMITNSCSGSTSGLTLILTVCSRKMFSAAETCKKLCQSH